MNNYFVGIDLSLTGTGFVILNDKEEIIHQKLISTTVKDSTEKRLITITDYLVDEIVKLYEVDDDTLLNDKLFINIEGLSFGSKGQSMLELAGLHYFLRCRLYALHHSNLTYETIPPTALKKWICGVGTAKKELMLLKVFKKFGVEFSDNNICDAFCLAKLAYFRQQETGVK